ncbi:metalloregulator ArsR/SmtB family transcription factor [Deltaproteobacteria bacterium TL4]
MSTKNVKKELFEQLARVGKALGSGNRLELLEFLAQGEWSVEALAKASGLTMANTSQHLRQLHQAGLVTTRKEGLFVHYQLADEAVVDLLSLLRKIAENNLAEVDLLIRTYLTAKDHLEPISSDDLFQRLQEGLVTVVDVRSPEEFASGHLPGAINMPLKDLEAYLEKLSQRDIDECIQKLTTEKEIIAYCRGPYCMLSFDAVSKLRKKGYQARRFKTGYPEWKREGFPVEVSASEK